MQATFAAGCFWGVEGYFKKLEGVSNTKVGYIGGQLDNPTYEQVCRENTGHAEAILIDFEPDQISFSELLNHFFKMHNPTQLNRQGPDVGTQYRSAVFYHDQNQKEEAEALIEKLNSEKVFKSPIVTTLEQASTFFDAEEYHQDYLAKNGGSCSI